jgi:hypothetical protein
MLKFVVRRLTSRTSSPRARAQPLGQRDREALEALRRAAAALENLGVVYWITYGTLLGWRRAANFLPFDDDIDIAVLSGADAGAVTAGMLARGFAQIEESSDSRGVIGQKFLLEGVSVEMIFVSRAGNFHVDCFPVLDGSLMRSNHPCQSLSRVDFRGLSLPAPTDPDAYLAHLYGPEWQKPVTRWHWVFSPNNVTDIECRLTDLPRLTWAWLEWKFG